MQPSKRIEFSRLLGFEAIRCEWAQELDFKDEAVAARLGAKVGLENTVAADLPREFPFEPK